MSCRLFMVEDPRAPGSLAQQVGEFGYPVDAASHSEFMAEIGLADTFDLIIVNTYAVASLDNGLEICSELRRRMIQIPVLILAASADLDIKVAAFHAGADDCLTKPVDPSELRVRIEALLRRSAQRSVRKISAYEFGGMQVDFTKSAILRCGVAVGLSERESRLLQYFVENRGKTISRNTLLRQVWGYPRAPLTRTVDVHILRLRQKVEGDPRKPQFIVTVPGMGYRFDG